MAKGKRTPRYLSRLDAEKARLIPETIMEPHDVIDATTGRVAVHLPEADGYEARRIARQVNQVYEAGIRYGRETQEGRDGE